MSVQLIANDVFKHYFTPEPPLPAVRMSSPIMEQRAVAFADSELGAWVDEHTLTIEKIIAAVSAVGGFRHSITHEHAMCLQKELNDFNAQHPLSQIRVLMGTEDGGYRWYYWGPNVALNIDQAFEVCCIFRSYMTDAQRAEFDAQLKLIYPFHDFFTL